jgi:predicted 3-demethylubiquinone-9 3-methyltransferase (glyoxalase superfamily)
MQKIRPFLWFDGKAEEAMMLYTSIFKDSKVIGVTRYGDAGRLRKELSCPRRSSSTGRNSSH